MIALLATLLAVVTAPYAPPSYACDGSTTAYTVNFPFQSSADVDATVTPSGGVPSTLALGTDYVLNVSSTQTTATLTLLAGSKCPSGYTLKIFRSTPLTQPQSFRQQTKFDPTTVETVADRAEMQTQEAGASIAGIAALVAAPVLPQALTNATPIQQRDGTNTLQLQDWFNLVYNVKSFGALGDNSHDDTTGINNAIQAAINSHTFGACVYLPAGRYLVTDQIKMFKTPANTTADGLCVLGDGQLTTIIESNFTDVTKSAIKMNGGSQRLENLAVDMLGDHLAGIEYAGDAVGRSTMGYLSNLHVNCQDHKGHGFFANTGQADLAQVNNSWVENCSQLGAAIFTNSDNVLTLGFYHGFWNRNTFGVWNGSSSDVFLYGVEIDATDVLVRRDAGNVFGWYGGRAEGPKHIFWDPAGANTNVSTFSGVRFDSLRLTRPASTTFSVTAATNAVTASASGFVLGDKVVLSGAGAAGATIKVSITGMIDMTHWSFPGTATTTVSGGAMGFYGYNPDGTRCKVATTNTTTGVIFSTPFCAVPGEFININDCSDPTTPVTINASQITSCAADGFTCTMVGTSNATNAAACWYNNAGVTTSWQPQAAWVFQGIGPYVITGNSFGPSTAGLAGTTGVAAAVASTTGVFFDSNSYAGDIGHRNPFATPDPIRNQFVLHNMFAGTINQSSVVTIDKQLEVAYSASITPDAYLCNVCTITANNGTAFTINNPLNAHDGMRLKFIVRNTSGGALGVITWGAAFKMAAFTNPLNANSRSVEFTYNSLRAVWVQNYQSAADVPN